MEPYLEDPKALLRARSEQWPPPALLAQYALKARCTLVAAIRSSALPYSGSSPDGLSLHS